MKKILVIDDDPDILNLISYILKEEGYNVKSSVTGKIITKINKIKPDLILMDCWLPGEFGDDLCKELKADPVYSHIPVILISAIQNLGLIAKERNANAYLEKPFDVEQLVAIVERHCL